VIVYELLQATILALLLAACLLHVFAKFAPERLRLTRGWLARRINGDAAWRQRLAQRLLPPARVSLGCATSACGSSCDGCGPSKPA